MQLGTEAARVREALLPPLNEALGLPSYSSQMTRFNHRFWKQVPGQQETNLIYLEQESLVRELILRNHLDSETFVRSLLSDAAIQESIETHFSGIMGAFDT